MERRARFIVLWAFVTAAAFACGREGPGKTVDIAVGKGDAVTPGVTTSEPEGDVKVLTVPSSKADAVDFRILFRSGSVDDPKGKEGLTALTASLVAEGGTG